MPDTNTVENVPAALRAAWQTNGTIPAGATWNALTGGRTNPVWRVECGSKKWVCKLHRADTGTPLFPNRPEDEAVVLAALDGTGLGPRLLDRCDTPLGISVLLSYVTGVPWSNGNLAAIARLLRRVHAQSPPGGLPVADQGGAWLIEQGRAMSGARKGGLPPAPSVPETEPLTPVLRHGDPVPGNILVDGAALTLVDWQCPSIGDPCDDIAVFLSPAMQAVNGNTPLADEQITAFLNAYGDASVTARYRALAPAYHWRMAAYCLWKTAGGDKVYRDAAALEIAALGASDH